MADYIFWLKSHNCTTKGSLCLHCESLLLKYPIKHLKVTFLFTEMTCRSAQRGWREREYKGYWLTVFTSISLLLSTSFLFGCSDHPSPLSLSLRACFAHLTSLQWLTARKSTKQCTAWYDHLQTPVPPPTGSSRPLLGYSGPFPCSLLLNCIDNSLTGHSRSQETLSLLLSGKPVQQGHRSPTDSQTASYKLPPNERISLKCRACLSASLFLKGGKEAGHRGEKVQASFQQNSVSTKQHFYPHKEPPWVNICTKLNVRSIRTHGTRVNVNVMVMSYL